MELNALNIRLYWTQLNVCTLKVATVKPEVLLSFYY